MPVFMSGTHIRGFRNTPTRTPPMNYPKHTPVDVASKLDPAIHNLTRAAGIMFRLPDNRILVSRRHLTAKTCPGMLQIPGGKVGPHESARDAAIRETKEETDLTVDSRQLVSIDFDHTVWNAAGEPYQAHVFLLDVSEEPEGTRNMEPDKYGPWHWMHMDAVLADKTIPGLVAAIKHLQKGNVKAEPAVKPPAMKKPAAKKRTIAKFVRSFGTLPAKRTAKKPALKKVVRKSKPKARK